MYQTLIVICATRDNLWHENSDKKFVGWKMTFLTGES